MDATDRIITGIAILIVCGIVIFGITDVRAGKACLVLGYPSHKITWNLDAYCIKRVDQTDVVVKL